MTEDYYTTLNVDRNAIVTVDGEVVDTRVKTSVWIFNKPKNCLVTKSDPKGRDTIYNFLPKELKNIISVGRLDYNSEGLLILTNNGDLSRYLELPKNNFKRTYKVRVFGKVDEKMQQVMELRDAGKKAHEEGDHAKSEELLIKALNLFKS